MSFLSLRSKRISFNLLPTASALSATVGQVSETDLAQPIAVNPKRRLVNQIAETDLAQPLTHRKLRALGQASEAELAQSISVKKTKVLGQSSEADLAQALTHRKTKLLGQALEDDRVFAVGHATLSGTAVPSLTEAQMVAGGRTIVLTLHGHVWQPAGSSFDSSRALILSSLLSAQSELHGWNNELNTIALSAVVRTSNDVVTITLPAMPGYSVTANESLSCSISYFAVVDASDDLQCADTMTITNVAGGLSVSVNQVVETDLAQPLTHRKVRTLGQVSEAELAQPITAKKTKVLGQPSEADLAQAVTHRKAKLLGQVSETDLAQPISRPGILVGTVNQVSETDQAQPIAWAPKRRLINQVVESEAAQPLTHRKLRVINLVTESELAPPLSRQKLRGVGLVVETDLAQPLAHRKVKALGQASETDVAQPIVYTVFLVGYIRIAMQAGSLPTCRTIVGRLPTAQDLTGSLPTITTITGVL